MEEQPFLQYLGQVFLASLNWILSIYPGPAIFFTVFVTFWIGMRHWFRGDKAEVSKALLNLKFAGQACGLAIVIVFFVYGPYLYIQNRETKLSEHYSTIEKSKNNELGALNTAIASLERERASLQDKLHTLEKAKTSHRDRLCSSRVRYKLTPKPLPNDPYHHELIVYNSKPDKPMVRFRIISTAELGVLKYGEMVGYSGGALTDDREPITEVSFPNGVHDEASFTIQAREPFEIKCMGRIF